MPDVSTADPSAVKVIRKRITFFARDDIANGLGFRTPKVRTTPFRSVVIPSKPNEFVRTHPARRGIRSSEP